MSQSGKAFRMAMRVKLYEAQNGRCCYCRHDLFIFEKPERRADTRLGTLEHLKRLADGGKNTPDNLALACQPCNTTRFETNWVEFATLMQRAV